MKACKKSPVFVILLSVAFAMGGYSLTGIEIADALYETAEKQLAGGNCINASENVNRAFKLYTRENYVEGITKATDLIAKVDDCLQKSATQKYDTANKYFVQKKYPEAIVWAQKAREDCQSLLPSTTGTVCVEKCDKLISDAGSMIEIQKNAQAEEKYNRAYALYEQDDFLNAKKLAVESLNLYNETNNAKGMKLCNALLLQTDKEVEELRSIADDNLGIAGELYRKAINQTNFEDYLEAIKKAQESAEIYTKIGYPQGLKDANELIASALRDIDKMEGIAKQKALAQYNEGRDDLVLAKVEPDTNQKKSYLDEAEKYFNNARSIYQMLYQRAKNVGDFNKEEAYRKQVGECDQKIADVQTERKNMAGEKNAEDQYTAAQSLYTKGECEKALNYANQAKNLFTAANERTGVLKCNTLIYQINECIKKINNAKAYLTNAGRYYKAADYVNATLELDKAARIYADIKNQQGVDYCNALKQNVTNSSKKKLEADKLMSQAYEEYEKKHGYEEAKDKALDAENIYSSIGYAEGVAKAKELINKSEERITASTGPKQWETTVTIGAIIGAIALVIIFWSARNISRQKAEKQKADTEKKRIEEEVRRRKEEQMRKEEARQREIESERHKLRSEIETERRNQDNRKQ